MGKRVLLTGGSGLLALAWALAVRNQHSVILGLHQRSVRLLKTGSVGVDLESAQGFASVLRKHNVDVVIHTAGLTNVEQCEANPQLAWHVNCRLATNVAAACSEAQVALVHISTDHLFQGTLANSTEESPVNPLNVYGLTKAKAESEVLKACPSALVVRTNFFGWGSSYRRSFSDFILDSLRVGKPLALFSDVYYSPILAENVAHAVHALLDQQQSGIFNAVGDERVSKYEFGRKIAKRFGLDAGLINPISIANRAELVKRPRDMSLSNDKMCKALDRRLGNLDDQLQRLWQQEQRHENEEVRDL